MDTIPKENVAGTSSTIPPDAADERVSLLGDVDDDSDTSSMISIPLVDFSFSTVPSERTKMFSDAVWSIIATIMILPVMHMKSIEELGKHSHNYTEEGIKFDKLTIPIMKKLGIFFLVFLIICNTWASHVWTFQPVKKITDFIALVNLMVLLLASFIPYAYTLMSAYRVTLTIVMYCVLQILIGLVQVLLVYHLFSYEGLLRKTLETMTVKQKKLIRRRIIIKIIVAPALCFVAIICSFFSIKTAFSWLFFILVYPWIQSFLHITYNKIIGDLKKESFSQKVLHFSERVPKSRIEGFSDGVFAITSTLFVIEITEKWIPTAKQVAASSLSAVLAKNWQIYLIYFAAFSLIGLLWFNHMTLCRNVFVVSRTMNLINNLTLSCVGILPFSFNLTTKYKILSAGMMGLQVTSLAVCAVGLLQGLFYLIAFFRDKKNRPLDEPWLSVAVQPGGGDFAILMFQLFMLPVLCLITFGVSFSESFMATSITGIILIVAYVLALLSLKTLVFYIRPDLTTASAAIRNSESNTLRRDTYGDVEE